MIIRPDESEQISQIIREEIDRASQRIQKRMSAFECRPFSLEGDRFEGVRRFYELLVEGVWTESDEACLESLGDMSETEIMRAMREAFRRSRIHPIPGFAYLLGVLKKNEAEGREDTGSLLMNSSNMWAIEREQTANMLQRELAEAAREIAKRLSLPTPAAATVREQLEAAQGRLIARFTPLV